MRRHLHTGLGAAISILFAHASPASAHPWEFEAAVGAAESNASIVAPALGGRVGVSIGHVALSVRALDVAGGDSFSGWMALGEVRLHTADWLRPIRLHLAIAAGAGREISASSQKLPDGASPGFESGRTGPAFLASAGADMKLGEIVVLIDLAAFYWTDVRIIRGTSLVNGGLGGAFLLGIGL